MVVSLKLWQKLIKALEVIKQVNPCVIDFTFLKMKTNYVEQISMASLISAGGNNKVLSL